MRDFLFGAATILVLITLMGLVAMWRQRSATAQMMGVQLLGSGGVAVLLLLAVAGAESATLDVALLVALLAAVAAAAFRGVALRARRSGSGGDGP